MANRDYVKRGRGGNSRKPARKKAAPWRSGLLAIVLVVAFGYGLYILNSDPEPASQVSAPIKAKPKVKSKTKIPPIPEEKWDYVDTLPSREVEIKAKKQVVSDVPYVMQCGAYKNAQQASQRKLDIAFQGLKSRIRKKEDSDWYRVVLGPYKFKRQAERDKHKLQRAKIEPCAIWKDT